MKRTLLARRHLSAKVNWEGPLWGDKMHPDTHRRVLITGRRLWQVHLDGETTRAQAIRLGSCVEGHMIDVVSDSMMPLLLDHSISY